jgi:hypothetical protein
MLVYVPVPDVTCDVCSCVYVGTAKACPKCFPFVLRDLSDEERKAMRQAEMDYFRRWGTAGE